MKTLQQFGLLTVSGDDAAHFLQGQVTCNVHDIAAQGHCFAAICNAKGRAIVTFWLINAQTQWHLIMPIGLVEPVKQHLSRFVLRAKVSLVDNSADYALLGTRKTIDAPLLLHVALDKRTLYIIPQHALTPYATLFNNTPLMTDDEWLLADIQTGIPWLSAATCELFIPQMLNVDKLGGISFNKGCYVGQEIIARTHYLGQSKRGLIVATFDATLLPPEPTCSVNDAAGNSIGQVLIAQAGYALLVMPLSALDNTPWQSAQGVSLYTC